MSTVATPKAQSADIAAQITFAMRSMGLPPIPRNYELFYEAYIGSNPALTRRLNALGSRTTQEELDEIAVQFGLHSSEKIIESAHSRLASELESLLHLLKKEQDSLETYSKILGETYSRIDAKNVASVDIIRNAITILSRATGDTMAHGEKTAESVSQKSQEMDAVRRELDEYKRIANTDSLTRLANRRAFDEKLAALFSHSVGLASTALILIDIDHFKKINDSFGHPVGDKILATVAGVIRNNVHLDAFVARTGGEEFAVILEGISAHEVQMLCERIRISLEQTPFRNSRTGFNYGPVTVSLGFAMAADCEDGNELYSRSDLALYCAKNSGRNCSRLFEAGMQKEFSKSWLIYRR
ncbi:GGDEF domain-containing protein [Rhizobium paknamense]|uniref:diguanylate cyclase n=1 Tax=Rhizobium paknamense TaxID=1206817 RepID=A0ABU0I9D1_9HYPH|nr:GGDEF domain-containing protein [Rhizobium paknamense]MDQ0453876.1 diguanylate cyclase [Rhizobium paknamense]